MRPAGGNITGLASLSAELDGKRLELLKETLPRLSHESCPSGPSTPKLCSDTERDRSRSPIIRAQSFNSRRVKEPDDLNRAFEAITKARTGALIVTGGPFGSGNRKRIVEFAARSLLPAIYYRGEFVEDGGLMSYATNRNDLARAQPFSSTRFSKAPSLPTFPVEQPIKFELIINLKAAKQIGVIISPNVLARADRVIR